MGAFSGHLLIVYSSLLIMNRPSPLRWVQVCSHIICSDPIHYCAGRVQDVGSIYQAADQVEVLTFGVKCEYRALQIPNIRRKRRLVLIVTLGGQQTPVCREPAMACRVHTITSAS